MSKHLTIHVISRIMDSLSLFHKNLVSCLDLIGERNEIFYSCNTEITNAVVYDSRIVIFDCSIFLVINSFLDDLKIQKLSPLVMQLFFKTS